MSIKQKRQQPSVNVEGFIKIGVELEPKNETGMIYHDQGEKKRNKKQQHHGTEK